MKEIIQEKYTKTLIVNSISISEKLILNLLKDAKNYNVLIVSYEKDNLNYSELATLSNNYNFNTFDIYLPKTKDINEIKTKLSNISKESIIFFIGLEKIFLNISQNNLQIKNGTKLFNYHSYENIDSQKVISFIEELYKEFNLHFLFLVQTNVETSERITIDLDEYDIEILSLKYENDDSIDIQNDILITLKNVTYEESMKILKESEDQYTKLSLRNMQVMIWLQHGFLEKATKFLKENFKILVNSEKKQLANLYYFDEKYDEAYNIAYSIFKENPLTIGLNTLLLKIAIKLNKFEEHYQEILEIDENDINVLELCADYFTKDETFDKAVKFRNKLFNITKEPFHLLLSEINKIEENIPKNGHIAKQQILTSLVNYDDEILEIETNYRLARIWFEIYESPYQAYKHFKNVLKICNNVHSIEAAKYDRCLKKLDIDSCEGCVLEDSR